MNAEVATVQAANVPMELTAKQVMGQVQLIQEVMASSMKNGEHYGVIPGCGTKPALLKAGAEKLSLTFRLAPSYIIERLDLPNGHREYIITCELRHIETGKLLGAGVGSCSTMESKYRWRSANRKCPECGKETIIKGKADFGGGWLCFGKKGGCGAKWKDGDAVIESQEMGRIENADIADQYNTVLKMGKKRAQVDATLTALAASDIFTQDIEERLEDSQGAVNVQVTVVSSEPATKPQEQAKPASPNGEVPAEIIAKAKKYSEECETIAALSDLKKEMVDKGWPAWSNETKAILNARHAVLVKIKEQEEELNNMESHGMDSYERDKKA
jgi:metal-sulfur cluster biosynthetic enzyme